MNIPYTLYVFYNKIIVSFQITCCFDIIHMKTHEFNVTSNTPANEPPGKPIVHTTIDNNLPWLFDGSVFNWFPYARRSYKSKKSQNT